jgi:hypothetical protein
VVVRVVPGPQGVARSTSPRSAEDRPHCATFAGGRPPVRLWCAHLEGHRLRPLAVPFYANAASSNTFALWTGITCDAKGRRTVVRTKTAVRRQPHRRREVALCGEIDYPWHNTVHTRSRPPAEASEQRPLGSRPRRSV